MLRVELEDKAQGNKAQIASIRRDKNRRSNVVNTTDVDPMEEFQDRR
ncbi:hypothetical protein A2U01_0108422, partial [Trifolium medium]|nr:hypothetical protein [Trifolium medium]